ncbi:MAG TPA: biotin carboxylase N-terminal domain-containing protein [Acidimicrobiia bacterium]|nr:biotin carboxylase N-terminal domain-containing protein [Acidimicrobiia bacterium]
MIRRILVANRGEIARRVFRTCRDMRIETVAVYSDSDTNEPHVSEADSAVNLPGSTPVETYLNGGAVLAAADDSGADAIHPGYGFLAENPEFARAVMKAGLVWIGPPPAAIEVMGSKLASKRLVAEVGVPILPGVDLTGLDNEAIAAAATAFGYPVLVKASAGGGGKGMRVVDSRKDLDEAIAAGRREAAASFGDDTVFLEKYLEAPRHIEIQVFGDSHGNVVSLHERECSIQRRHQKIIEEAPSVAVDQALRARMSESAVAVARAADYVGAGTVEFLFQEGEFWFLEMNTRLQVEHPVTEMTTGLDLVRLQIDVANGGPLPAEALTPSISGHAVEARLYAEDPARDFLPVTGRFHRFSFPDRPGLRVDSGVEDGSTVSVHYDPMLAKVIAHAPTREEAASALAESLRHAWIHGPVTNRELLVRVLEHEDFVAGRIDTNFLDAHDLKTLASPLVLETEARLAAVAVAIADRLHRSQQAPVLGTIGPGWRNSPSQPQRVGYRWETTEIEVEYQIARDGLRVVGGDDLTVTSQTSNLVELEVDGENSVFAVDRFETTRYVDGPSGPLTFEELPRFAGTEIEEDPGSLHAPMPGRVIKVEVAVGDRVEEGQTLVVLEAMKMEHTLRAPWPGTVTSVGATSGQQVEAETVLVVVEAG